MTWLQAILTAYNQRQKGKFTLCVNSDKSKRQPQPARHAAKSSAAQHSLRQDLVCLVRVQPHAVPLDEAFLQVQYCTACRLVTPKQVVSGRLEVLSSADRRSCLHFAGEPMPEDADGETETVASASKVRYRTLIIQAQADRCQHSGRGRLERAHIDIGNPVCLTSTSPCSWRGVTNRDLVTTCQML